jgi:hypothetical protein
MANGCNVVLPLMAVSVERVLRINFGLVGVAGKQSAYSFDEEVAEWS